MFSFRGIYSDFLFEACVGRWTLGSKYGQLKIWDDDRYELSTYHVL